MTPVPCNGCVRCCTGDAVRLLEGDDAEKFLTVPHPHMPGARMLDHKPDGSCVYLAEWGCSIQHDKPIMCAEFDCRILARKLSYTGARKARIIPIWKKGEELNR
jgi:Fe-S-cluster containining protein